jgi:hypothetical protein
MRNNISKQVRILVTMNFKVYFILKAQLLPQAYAFRYCWQLCSDGTETNRDIFSVICPSILEVAVLKEVCDWGFILCNYTKELFHVLSPISLASQFLHSK